MTAVPAIRQSKPPALAPPPERDPLATAVRHLDSDRQSLACGATADHHHRPAGEIEGHRIAEAGKAFSRISRANSLAEGATGPFVTDGSAGSGGAQVS